MKGFLLENGVYKWLMLSIIIIFVWSVFRTEPVNLVEPITQIRVGRLAHFDFTVNKPGSYQFSLLLHKGYFKDDEVQNQKKLSYLEIMIIKV